ncbi:Crp/Fnr family transcriptional regulator [Kordiimonas aquimaris]|uniref:Crp/Fnr family transcriptional regulator n=1 Tax=Kordiimonas aquimaris TaxID=707591 RepID=UPI0021D1D0F1|nr:Crp/Fnr family transcriptional regulator [Kordiimonas aquimaris]
MMTETLASFFGDDPDVLADLSILSTQSTYLAGSMIVAEGDTDDSVFFILTGEARALRYSVSGVEVFIDSFTSGDLIGEMAVLGDGMRTADIYALTDVRLMVFSGPTFIGLMEKHGKIGLRVSRLLAARIQQTTRRMFEQSTLSSKGRVYAELMRLAQPQSEAEVLKITDAPSISDIAKKLGVARETVSRTVNGLKDDAILEKRGTDIFITNPQVLVQRLGQD